jgi:1-acyl-sn-glycerol-3-phosphate acyltransferase
VEGIEPVPIDGHGLIVPNHGGGALHYDAMMVQLAVLEEAPIPRRVRMIGTEIFNMVPWLSHLYRRSGGGYAARADADWILSRGHLLGVFPEGAAGFQKPHSEAYRVQRFGRGGFAATAAAHDAPIVPVAVVGSEDVHPIVFSSSALARVVRLVFPDQRVDEIGVFLNPIPLPVHWSIRFLEPISLGPDPDRLDILEAAEATRTAIQRALDDMLGR